MKLEKTLINTGAIFGRIIASFDNDNDTTTTVYLLKNRLIEITVKNNRVIEIKEV